MGPVATDGVGFWTQVKRAADFGPVKRALSSEVNLMNRSK